MKYELMKVYDCQDMPENVKKAFFEHEDERTGNDCYVSFYVGDNKREHMLDCSIIVEDWLLENGANDEEPVLINHWW